MELQLNENGSPCLKKEADINFAIQFLTDHIQFNI